MNFSDKNNRDFIDHIIRFNHVDDILAECKTQAEKGIIFEKLFDIVIKFGFCSVFPNSDFNHLIGNSNTAKLKVLSDINSYLNAKVLTGNSCGCSDITLQNKYDNTYIFISSKFPKNDGDLKEQKSVKYYDVQGIIAMADANKCIYENYKIFLVVSDKEKLLNKVKASKKSSEYITDHMTEENILDKTDLNKYFLAFRQDIIKNKNEDWQSIYFSSKENLVLRFHQELITQKTHDLIQEGHKDFLWGCKCRSGKTYMVGGLILKLSRTKKSFNVLVITPAPSETTPQFTNDLFNKFKDFYKFKIHEIAGSQSLNNLSVTGNNIFVASKQLLQKYINGHTVTKIKQLELDVIIFDENHFSGTTEISKNILTSYSSKKTVKVYLTATYNKPLKEWNISPECQMFWDIEDEQICKSILIDKNNLSKLNEKHGDENVTKTLEHYDNLGLSLNDIFQCYKKMPDLHVITNMFDQQRYETLKESMLVGNKMGFCFDTLFKLNSTKTQFEFQNEVKTVLRYISGSQKENDGDKTIFTRINFICSEKETRVPFTQIWFLPPVYIDETSRCLKKLMLEDLILKKYDIMCVNRNNKVLAKAIKDDITKKEIEAKAKGQLGLIILAGNMLSLGITLDLCDLVILMNNTISADKVLQQMYRCMTEGPNKKIGFVVDLHISRVLNTCINYTVHKHEMSIDEKITYLIKNHLINIDVDMFWNKRLGSDMIIKKLIEFWKKDPINGFKILLKKLDDDYVDFDNQTQRMINSIFTQSTNTRELNLELRLKDETDEIQDLSATGESVTDDELDDNEQKIPNKEENKQKEEKEIFVSFTKDVLPYVLPLTSILTIKNTNMDFTKMLNDINENPELLEIFDEQCLMWWNRKDLIKVIRDIMVQYRDKSPNTNNVSIQLKLSLKSLLDDPDALLELINDCLKPKEVEKKENGEVFTPMHLVNEMLDKLPKDIWKNKNLKWLDPANGMGNFPIAIYLRLMEGLQNIIEDQAERKRHILENMIYMCELNKKNVFICKQIFDINNEYKLNLYQGDTLKFDPFETFKVKQFDIIVGNPPYNKGGIRSHTGKHLGEKNETIWTKFIEKAFEWLKPYGYLLYITPLSWLKKTHSLHDTILEKHIIWIKLWDNIKSLAMINGKIPISLFVLHNIPNIGKKCTEIISQIQSKKIVTSSNEYMDKKYSIPLAYHSIFNKLIQFIEKNDLRLEYKTKTIKASGKKVPLPIDYKSENMLAVDTYTVKEGLMIKKALQLHPDAEKRKLIIANKSSFAGIFIDEGKLGLTGTDKVYILGDNLELILKMFQFKICDIISQYTKYRQDFLNTEAFSYIPDIRKLKISDINENQFYEMIGLTPEQINTIDKTTKQKTTEQKMHKDTPKIIISDNEYEEVKINDQQKTNNHIQNIELSENIQILPAKTLHKKRQSKKKSLKQIPKIVIKDDD